jgi:hypothetical protein
VPSRKWRPLVRQSWSRLLWLLAGFALCQVVLAVAIDCWLGAVRDPEYAGKLERLKARLAEAPERPLVLMLGSSRTAYGVDARNLSASGDEPGPVVFNFGLMGGGPLLETVAFSRLLAEGIRPDMLFVEVMPALLAECDGRLLEEKMLDGARLCAREVLRLRRHYHEPRRVLSSWFLGRLLPCHRHQAEVRGELGLDAPDPGWNPTNPGLVDDHGWRARTDEISEDYRRKTTEMALSQYDEFCASAHLGAEAVQALEELLAQCHREGIPVSLVLMPEGAPFRALYSPEARAALDGLLTRLQQRWGVKVIDARTWVDDRGFWDTHHLLAAGARQFTERFGREALQPAMQELRPATHARAKS